VTTPELIREVSLGRAGEFHRDALKEAISDLVSGATNVLSGSEHDLRRRMIAPAFRQGRLTEYAKEVAGIAGGWSRRCAPVRSPTCGPGCTNWSPAPCSPRCSRPIPPIADRGHPRSGAVAAR
jgi:hypothetical protein